MGKVYTYVAVDLIPILFGSLPLAHNAQHSLVFSTSTIGIWYMVYTYMQVHIHVHAHVPTCTYTCMVAVALRFVSRSMK